MLLQKVAHRKVRLVLLMLSQRVVLLLVPQKAKLALKPEPLREKPDLLMLLQKVVLPMQVLMLVPQKEKPDL